MKVRYESSSVNYFFTCKTCFLTSEFVSSHFSFSVQVHIKVKSPLLSTHFFASWVWYYLEAFHHLSFYAFLNFRVFSKHPSFFRSYLLLNFRKSPIEPSQGTESSFYLLLYFHKSCQGHLKALNHLRFPSLLYFC